MFGAYPILVTKGDFEKYKAGKLVFLSLDSIEGYLINADQYKQLQDADQRDREAEHRKILEIADARHRAGIDAAKVAEKRMRDAETQRDEYRKLCQLVLQHQYTQAQIRELSPELASMLQQVDLEKMDPEMGGFLFDELRRSEKDFYEASVAVVVQLRQFVSRALKQEFRLPDGESVLPDELVRNLAPKFRRAYESYQILLSSTQSVKDELSTIFGKYQKFDSYLDMLMRQIVSEGSKPAAVRRAAVDLARKSPGLSARSILVSASRLAEGGESPEYDEIHGERQTLQLERTAKVSRRARKVIRREEAKLTVRRTQRERILAELRSILSGIYVELGFSEDAVLSDKQRGKVEKLFVERSRRLHALTSPERTLTVGEVRLILENGTSASEVSDVTSEVDDTSSAPTEIAAETSTGPRPRPGVKRTLNGVPVT